jgi:hypothetical protein
MPTGSQANIILRSPEEIKEYVDKDSYNPTAHLEQVCRMPDEFKLLDTTTIDIQAGNIFFVLQGQSSNFLVYETLRRRAGRCS